MSSWGDSHRFLVFYTAGDCREKIYLDKVNLTHMIPPAVCTVYIFANSEMSLILLFLQVQKEITTIPLYLPFSLKNAEP